mgnify:CR=1 FL=1
MPLRRADDKTYQLGTNASGTGAANGATVQIPGGEYTFLISSTANTGTLSLQIQEPQSLAWIDLQVYSGSYVRTTQLQMAQPGIYLPACNVRWALAGGNASNVYATLQGEG